MRQGPAFQFIPELLGGLTNILSTSEKPQLYIETGMETIHMAANVFKAFMAHANTKEMESTLNSIREVYKEIEIKKLEAQYEKIKGKIEKEKYADEVAMGFIHSMQDIVRKYINFLFQFKSDKDYIRRSDIEEMIRKTINSYYKMMQEIL